MNLSAAPHRTLTRATPLTFVGLESFPCGCVSSVYRVRPETVEVEVVEAKGVHCPAEHHRVGEVVRLGLPAPWLVDDSDPLG